MPRIIDGERNNMVANRFGITEKKKIQPENNYQKAEVMAIYICRGSSSRIEDGSRTVTDIELYGLATVLGVSIESLFPFSKKRP